MIRLSAAAISSLLLKDDMHVYHRNDLRFNVAVGARIPGTITFYDAPSQHLSIDPEFQGYKIVILDDVVLIIDPDTRERRSHPNVGGQAPNTLVPTIANR
jgi:Protein of unknown function (DUF1236)